MKYNNITFGFRDLRRDDWKRITEKEVIVEDEKNDFFACDPDVDRRMRTCDVFIQVDVKRYFRISRADRKI